MEPSFLLVAGAAGLLFVLWRIVREFIVKSPVDNVRGPPSPSSLVGHIVEFFESQGGQYSRQLAEAYGSVVKLRGILGARMLLVADPRALHSLLIKDAEAYPKCPAPFDEFMLLLGPSLLTTERGQHRRQRKQLNPVFSIAHLRNMTDIFYHIAGRTCKAIDYRVGPSPDGELIDVNGWMARTTLEMLGQAALGYSFDNFVDDSTDAFGESLKSFFPTYSQVALIGFLIPIMSYVMPCWLIAAILRAIPHAELQKMMRISSVMAQRSKEIINEKKMALMKGDDELKHKVGEGKDLMSILLRANMLAPEEEKLTDEELIAQMSTFMLAGMDTTSNALTRVLHILAQRPEEQERLRAEVTEARNGNDLTYDALDRLPYLDAVCRETLRLYPPVAAIGRGSSKDMKLPLHTPIVGEDGTIMHEVPVPAGIWVLVNIQASNCNPDLWGEDAFEWKPDRWLKPFPTALEDARIPGVYSNLLSFSGGSRSCIGFKFSQLEMKVVLSLLISSFKFEMTDKPIVWKTSAVSFPTMGEESTKPELLLKVTRVKA
ncbi:cytochrome P450 [Trametes coccinea BRFM310]|uniref:Cytochrome P450 n=1 Tax=Trametes coccinea (strain BRFM310) TaxID=1353009 RepID=A0A1Y2IM49_TRAC3|nr:cytochrome P450 [Trametes coccinea BRFM310]